MVSSEVVVQANDDLAIVGWWCTKKVVACRGFASWVSSPSARSAVVLIQGRSMASKQAWFGFRRGGTTVCTTKSRESRYKAGRSMTNDVVSGLPRSKGRSEKVEDKSPVRWVARKSLIDDRTGEGSRSRRKE